VYGALIFFPPASYIEFTGVERLVNTGVLSLVCCCAFVVVLLDFVALVVIRRYICRKKS
jgi:hypothetical protein